jgi:hypothetical protein
MAAAIGVREDHVREDLRRLPRGSREGSQVRRLVALAVIFDGASRSDLAPVSTRT